MKYKINKSFAINAHYTLIKSLYLPSSVSGIWRKSETKCKPITCEEMFLKSLIVKKLPKTMW